MFPCFLGNCLSRLLESISRALITIGLVSAGSITVSTVPKITIVIGKAYGGAYIAMGSKNLRTDINYAWPTAQIAVLGSEGAVKIMNRKELANAEDPEALKKQLVDEFTGKFANPYVAASHGTVDTVIDPSETRTMIIKALEMLSNKRDRQLPRKHGNINL